MRRGIAVLLAGAWLAAGSAAGAAPPLRLAETIQLPDVEGRIDHLALDASRRRLFVAALGNDSVEVIDLAHGRVSARVAGLEEPQGVLLLPGIQQVLVTLGGAAALAVVRSEDLAVTARIALREDPDNLRYEAGAGRVWVGAGTGASSALEGIDPAGQRPRVAVALDGHPESFALEAKGPRIFVNVPSARHVAVVDREQQRVSARWKLPCAGNFPMSLDEERRHLYVVCRRPARLVALDTATGAVAAEVDAPGDADDLFVDAASGRLYVAGGAGVVRVYFRGPGDRLASEGDVATGRGARTCLLDAEGRRLYVAVPRRGAEPAEILGFETPR